MRSLILSALRKVIAESILEWTEDYDEEDLADALDHYNLMANRNFKHGLEYDDIENTGTEIFDPKELLNASIKSKKPKGWLKNIPKSEWIEEFKKVYDRDLTYILSEDEIKLPILIEGDLCDGYARVTLAYALGEKVPVAIFEGVSN